MLNKILELDKKGYAVDIYNTDHETLEVVIEKDGYSICQLVNFEGMPLDMREARMVLVLNYMEAEFERKLNDAN